MLQCRSEAMHDTPDTSSSRQEGNSPASHHPTAPSHRAYLEDSGSTVVAPAAVQTLVSARADAVASAMAAGATASAQGAALPSRTAIRLHVNGVSHSVEVEDRWTLAELLRDQLDLTGTKIGCDRSEC